jgi:hypothetical protein
MKDSSTDNKLHNNFTFEWIVDQTFVTNFIEQQKVQLIALLNTVSKIQSRADFKQFINMFWPRLSKYKSYTSFKTCVDWKLLQNIHKELSYLLITHPDFIQNHPLFFGFQQDIIKVVSQKIWAIAEYDTRTQNMQKYLYRLPNFWFIKEENWFMLKMNKLYNDPYFLSRGLSEIVLVDMIAKDFFPHCTVRLASNIDDRRFWFDAIVMSPFKNLCFIDFTFMENKDWLNSKKNKINKLIASKNEHWHDNLCNSEFAIYAYEKFDLSVASINTIWAVFQIDKRIFEKQWLPSYLQYVFPWKNNHLHADKFIHCDEMDKLKKFMK